jgi:S-adenosylmethionine synthetase
LAATVANGHPDKIQGITDLLLAMVLQEVRKEVRQPKKISEEVAKQMMVHVANCPMAGESNPALPKAIAWAYPLRWQITIIIAILGFAPQAPVVISAIMNLTGN